MIDSHAHLTSVQILPDIDEVLKRADAAGVSFIVNICTDEASLKEGLALQKRVPQVKCTAATTPHDVEKEGELFFPLVEQAAKEGKLVAIGESGLDYYYEHSPKERQQYFLRRYLKLAQAHDLPIVIHCRDAFPDFLTIIDEIYQEGKGVLHCFTGTVAEAKEVLKRGWYLSLSGIVTFKKSEQLRDVARITPLDQLLIETDSPYLAPQSKRGGRNEPAFVIEVAETIAREKGISLKMLVDATTQNAKNLFRFSE